MKYNFKNNPFEKSNSFDSSFESKQLEWQESAIDNDSTVNEIFDQDRKSPSFTFLKFAVVFLALVFVGKLFVLQIINGKQFRNLSENNRIRKQPLLAPRGLIFDRYKQILAQNRAGLNLVAVPFDLQNSSLENQIKKLSEFIDFDQVEILNKLVNIDRKSLQPIVIKQNITSEQSILFETRASEFIGFSIQKIPIRDYLDSKVFAHLLGYTGQISKKDFEELKKDGKYEINDTIGKSGVEQIYEQYLHGINGNNLIEIDATGKLLKVLGESQPLPGNSLVLNIDKALQSKIYESLTTRGSKSRKAAVVALNPKTGEVLSFVSLPSFENNLFAQGITQTEYQKFIDDPNLPLFNRGLSGTYPPGSTVKPMVAAAALEEGIVSENTIIVDKGVLIIPNQYNSSILYSFYGWKRSGLGPVDVRSAIARSSDIYFYIVSGGHPSSSIKGLGAEKLAEYYRKFNLGKMTGIDLPGEKPGLVADPKWKAEYFKLDPVLKEWYLGNTYHIGIGQGDMLATPLQVALWTAIIANQGVGYKPQIAKQVENADGLVLWKNQPEVIISKFLDDRVLKIVQEGMRQTIISGSGQQLMGLPINSAGKTGTSQFDGSDPNKTHAWFTVYAPYEDPEIVITVLIEAGGEGHAVAVPVAKDALLWWAENRYKKIQN